ncbi:MAG TPA: AAA family ATPase [Opitutaceae bacterium]|nr:AAA family ATPase [Opitutaceae bacterium]
MSPPRLSKTAAKKKTAPRKMAPATPPPRILVVGGHPGASVYGVVCALAIDAKKEIHRVDLAALVSQHTEETKGNLDKLFRQAKAKDRILFFEDADTVFERRREVRNSHDRYANIDVNHLLEKLDRFPGMAVFASNRPSNLDDAVFRRCQQVISIEPPPPRRKTARG